MKPRFLFLIAAALVALAGCDKITKLSAGSSPQKIEPQKEVTPPAESGVVNQSEETQHNAVLEGEDESSRARRNKARASLGLGN